MNSFRHLFRVQIDGSKCEEAFRRFIVLVLIVASPAGVAVSQKGSMPAGEKALLDTQVQDNAVRHGIPAQAVVVAHHGETIYRVNTGTTTLNGHSPVGDRTVFPLFSVSKLYASVLLMQLVEQGKVDLSAPASRYVPSLPERLRGIPVGQYLSHTSGVPEYFAQSDLAGTFPPSLQAALEKASAQKFPFQPGEQSRYTQTNYLVIEAILEKVTGQPYRSLLQERIIKPLQLHETWVGEAGVPPALLVHSYRAQDGKVVPEPPVAWPSYQLVGNGVYATAEDLTRFLSAVAAGRLVSKAKLMAFWHPEQLFNGSTGDFATGWDYYESERWHGVGHDGGTKVRVRILFQGSLDDAYVIVYLTSGNKDGVWSRTLLDSIQKIVLPQ